MLFLPTLLDGVRHEATGPAELERWKGSARNELAVFRISPSRRYLPQKMK